MKYIGIVMEFKKIIIFVCSCSDCMDYVVYRKCLKFFIDFNELIVNLVFNYCMR